MQGQDHGFLGRAGRCVEGAGFRMAESSYSAGAGLPRHSHARAHVCLVVSGEYRETLRGSTESRGPMTLIYYPPDCPHAESHCAAGRHLLFDWDEEWARRTGVLSALPNGPTVVERPAALFAALRAFRSLREATVAASEQVEESLLTALLEFQVSARENVDCAAPWLRRVVERLRDAPEDAPSLSELAEEARVHPSHLARTFLRRTGCTIGQMRRRFQVERACRALAQSSASLSHVAVDAGFSDQSHMTRAIREATGFTPQALRDAGGALQAD